MPTSQPRTAERPAHALLVCARRRWLVAGARSLAIGLLWLTIPIALIAGEQAGGVEFYERKIRPILASRCYECHSTSAKHLEAGLRLDQRAGILHGGETGPAIVPGKPDESLLVQAVRYDHDTQMPPSGKLPGDEIALLADWVRRGAPLPDDGSAAAAKRGIDFESGRRFWSFRPLTHCAPPAVADHQWPRRAIDSFLLNGMERHSIVPSPPADRRTLIRRVSFDLIGLPPDADEVEQFAADSRPEAYEELVERLLASPHYGERWARDWLDLSRYADANETSLEFRSQAWMYRDWVIRAINDDLPYDQFVVQQLAADLLPGWQPADVVALGFLGISPVYFKELKLSPPMIEAIVADEWEERIDAIGRTFLGLSLACARCHDHKYDPISVDDYYALAGVLASTRLVDRCVLPEPQAGVVRKAREQVSAIGKQVATLKAKKNRSKADEAKLAELKQQINGIETRTPNYTTAMAHAVDDAALRVLPDGPNHTRLEYTPGKAIDLHVHIRGSPARPGRLAPRRFLTVLSPATPQAFTHGSGRLELARAIVTDGSALAARVIVNRVWKHHFGVGLVETPSDFGAQGARPSHPELLDDLAARFIEHGWSLKWLHREIVLSAAYQQSSAYDAKKFAVDPENRLLWRANRRRLEVEPWRDAMLKVCGTLDEQLGGLPLALSDPTNRRRTIYARISRADPDAMLRLFDFPDPANHSPDRNPTTTALQQLFVLNSPFMERQSAALAQRMASAASGAEQQVRWAYTHLFGRNPSPVELRQGTEFLRPESAAEDRSALRRQYAQALLGSNEFLFVD